ncbi:hypothetical protein Zmor_012137 [Zophobas morio]|uniref:Dermonecrotic toxin N-terminal domain-containing protein n=1 Tax=Zophobas morio TaxID=2755281 RepID=A0AA38LZ22_9CUCU|nr:hypothetical protein Zmor_012137 [Zophobas morio]
MLKSPLEKAKTVLEKNILLKLGKSINAYEYKYVSIIYANEPNGRVCYATMEETLAHCFLKNTWDREELISSIDKCGNTDIIKLDYQKDNSPNFIFDGRVNNNSLPCKSSLITSYTINWYFSEQHYERKKRFYVYSAIYHTNKSLEFTPQTQWDVEPAAVTDVAKSLDFDDIYSQYVNKYWENNFFDYSKHLRLSYLQSIIYQHNESSLSTKGAFLALQAAVGASDVSVYFVGLQKKLSKLAKIGSSISMHFYLLRPLVKYAYNIMCIMNNTDGHTLLYIIGNSSPIHEFSNITELNLWFVNQTKDENKRRILLSHFMLEDIEATWTHLSLDETMKNIPAINYKEDSRAIVKLRGPYPSGRYTFTNLTEAIKLKSVSDIPAMIVSNRDVTKKRILEWLDVISTILLPLTLIYPALILSDIAFLTQSSVYIGEAVDVVFLAQGLTQVGIAADDVAHYKDVGGKRLVFGLINAVPVAPAVFKRLSAVKSFQATLNNILSSDERALLKLEGEEFQGLPLDYDTSEKTEFNEDTTKISDLYKAVKEDIVNKDMSESFQAPESSVENSDITNLKLGKGTSQLFNSKSSSATRDELQKLVKSTDINFEQPLPNTQKPDVIVDVPYRLDLDSQASSMGKKIINFKDKQFLVENVNNELKTLYTFDLLKGKISNIKNTGKNVYYNEKTELWESLGLKGGAKDDPLPAKIRKLDGEGSSNTLEHSNEPGPSRLAEMENPNTMMETERAGSSSALELSSKAKPNEVENLFNLPKDGKPYQILNFKKELNMVVYDSKVNGYRYADVRTSNKYLSITTENELIEVSTKRPIIIPDESFIEDLTEARENLFVYENIEGTKNEGYITGIVFRENKFTVMYKGEMRTVLYNKMENYWHLEGSTRQLEYTANEVWVELQERNTFPIENNFLTHEKLDWNLQELLSVKKNYEVPIVLNFVLIEGVDKSAVHVLKNFKNAFYYSATTASEKCANLFVYGEETFINQIVAEGEAYSGVQVHYLELKEDMEEFYEDELRPYMEKKHYDLVSLLARLKLSQTHSGLFLANDVKVPANIFDRSVVTDEWGFLFQTPVLDEQTLEYVVPTDVIASRIREDKEKFLETFLSNLNKAKSNEKSVDNFAQIFTQTLKDTSANYREYLKYYSSIKGNGLKITGNSYKRINDYFEKLSGIGFYKYEKPKTFLARDPLVSPFLSKGPTEVDMMIKNNVQIVIVENKEYIVFPTRSNVRELYSFNKNKDSFTNVRSTGKTVYFNEVGGVQVLEEVPKLLTTESTATRKVSVPMDNIYTGKASNLFSNEYCVNINGARKSVIYDLQSGTWKRYSYSKTKIKLGPSITLKNGNWVEDNLLLEAKDELRESSPYFVNDYFLPNVPKIPEISYKLPKKIHFFIQDVESIKDFLYSYDRLPPIKKEIYLHYDFIASMEQDFAEKRNLFGNLVDVTLHNVREDNSLRPFFENGPLCPYYEAARKNGRYDVARDIMKYQIMHNNDGFFVNHEVEPALDCFKKKYIARKNDILLKYPDKIFISPAVVKFRASNTLFATFSNNNFFEKLNENILKNLEKDNGYYGSILKGEQPIGALFPLDDVVGSNVFHKTLIECVPETRDMLNYMNQDFFPVIYNDEFEKSKDFFFPIIS